MKHKVDLNGTFVDMVFEGPNAETMRARIVRDKTRGLPVLEVDFLTEVVDGPKTELPKRQKNLGWHVTSVQQRGSCLRVSSVDESVLAMTGVDSYARYDLVPQRGGDKMRFLMIRQEDVDLDDRRRFNTPVATVTPVVQY